MIKTALIITLLICCRFELFAQNNNSDSAAIKTKTAYAYGRYFKPTKQIRKAYRKHLLSKTSDYLEPTDQTVSNLNLLKDSTFVQAYKQAAYDNSVRNIRINRTVIIGGSILVASAIAALVVIVIKLAEGFAEAISKSFI